MQTQLIGRSSLKVSRLSYGCMRYLHTWNPSEVDDQRRRHAFRCIDTALDVGITLFDHADIYALGASETVFGEYLAQHKSTRDKITIATKCGIKLGKIHQFDFSKDYILRCAESSLRRLQTDVIDLYQLHRPDLLMNPAEVAEAFIQLHKEGKVREFGVSNFHPSQLSALQAFLPMPLVSNQIQLSLDCIHPLSDGTTDQCLERQMSVMAFSPIAGGYLAAGGTIDPKDPRQERLEQLLELLDRIAAELQTNRTAISLAWLLKHPVGIIPIVGSTNPKHIQEAALADSINLTRDLWYELFVQARGERLP